MKRPLMSLLATLAMSVLLAGPAAAADDLGVSEDAVTWSSTMPAGLFDIATQWVPGDSRTATFYVRNQSADSGKLTIDILGNHVGTLLDHGDLHITAKGGGGTWTPASDGAERRLLTTESISSGDVLPIEIAVGLDEASGNQTRLLSSDLKFRVTLTQVGKGSDDNDDDDDDDDSDDNQSGNGGTGNSGTGSSFGSIPGAGAPDITWIAALGSVLLGTGVAVVSRRRHNHQGASHV